MIPDSTVERWLTEDLGHHDVTNDLPGTTTGRLVAREAGVAAGLEAASAVFDYLDLSVETPAESGERVGDGEVALRVEGPTRDVLRGERVAANVAGHASGIATRTRRALERAREVDDDVRVAGTRKTAPGLRGVEKRAIAAGGGDTHRLDSSHMVMVKDNHIAELGLERAIERLSERASFTTRIEVEIERPEAAVEAADAGADIVLFDNLEPTALERGVALLPEDVLAEASGSITLETIPAYAETGVDIISMGALTHSAPSLDYSFRVG
jgi:nicotinate-nucleotide pyrophosphorylase (carboxylating)